MKNTLFTTVFGSKLYGTDTPESDTDLKSVYLPELSELLRGHRVKNSVHTTGDKDGKNTAEDEDHEHVPLQVFAEDFIKGQTYALEIAYVAIDRERVLHTKVYDERFIEFCEELTSQFLTSNIKAMLGYALGQAHKYGIKGTRLASLRKFKKMIDEQAVPDDTKLGDVMGLVEKVNEMSDKYLFMTTYSDAQRIDAPAISLLEKTHPMDIPMSEMRLRLNSAMKSYGTRAAKAEASGGHDWKAVSHAVRIALQALDILVSHKLEFPFMEERRQRLLSIKLGEVAWAEVEEELSDILEMVDYSLERTTLPKADNDFTARFDTWFMTWLYSFYALGDG